VFKYGKFEIIVTFYRTFFVAAWGPSQLFRILYMINIFAKNSQNSETILGATVSQSLHFWIKTNLLQLICSYLNNVTNYYRDESPPSDHISYAVCKLCKTDIFYNIAFLFFKNIYEYWAWWTWFKSKAFGVHNQSTIRTTTQKRRTIYSCVFFPCK